MSTWAPSRLERSDVLVGQREGNNEDVVIKCSRHGVLHYQERSSGDWSADIV